MKKALLMDNYKPHIKDGTGRTKRFSHKQRVVHLVKEVNGDNFLPALCGETPSGRSLGWHLVNQEPTCKKCIEMARRNG